MEPPRISGDASGNSRTYSPEVAEIQSLTLNPTFESPPVTGTSSTALLGLHPTETLALPFGCSPTFPSNASLIERAARLSVFAAAESPGVSNFGEISPAKIKTESCDRPQMTGNKRKQARNSKVKVTAKKSKRAEENTRGDQKLPYVHVRAQRGQATDSHSLAERARRKRINARMKLLQELVPGCNKISGTALVLEEIINHVQSLQRHVEVLSMRLAAVNPRIDLNELDNFLFNEGARQLQLQQYQPQMWLIDSQQQQQFSYDSPDPSSEVPLANQLKTEFTINS